MKVSNELLAYIEERNLETKAWVAEAEGRWAGYYPTDARHWEDRGIFTLAQLERDELITHIYEGHKDAYGVKGRHYDFEAMSLEQLKAEADSISNAISIENERMDAQRRDSIKSFEAMVEQYAPMAGSRKRAIRWMLESENLLNEGDVGYVQYCIGLPYDYCKDELTSILEAA